MKLLYHHRVRSQDGQFVHITEMIRALRNLGHEVIVVGPPAAKRARFGDDAGMVAQLKRYCPKFLYELMELAYSLPVYRRLRGAVQAHRPDALYERYSLFLPAGVWIKRRFGLPMLLEINAPLLEERSANDGIALTRLARWSQRYAWRGADRALPVTEVLARTVEAAGVPRENIVVIHNGINAAEFAGGMDPIAAKRALGLDGRLVLGFTGFVRDWHGMDKVVELMAAAPAPVLGQGWHLLIVGDGPARSGLERLARTLRVADRITITGVVQRDRIAAYVAAFDIALQPAVVDYASPLKLFEYMALGRAVVAPSQANIREILTHGEDALLFDPQDANGLGDAIKRLVADAGLRQRLGSGAQRTIKSRRLTWSDNATRVSDIVAGFARRPALEK